MKIKNIIILITDVGWKLSNKQIVQHNSELWIRKHILYTRFFKESVLIILDWKSNRLIAL